MRGPAAFPVAKPDVDPEKQFISTEELKGNVAMGPSESKVDDTGAAVSVMDAQYLQELNNGQLPSLNPNSPRVLKTVSGEDLAVRGIFRTTINIAGGNYPCEFKDIEEDLVTVVAPATYTILPRCETIIPAKLTEDSLPGTVGLTDSASTLAESYQLQGAAALVCLPNGVPVPFHFINPTRTAHHTPPAKDETDTVPVDLQTSVIAPDEQNRPQ
ncbi:hypothetical protein ACROYT_G034948 [Oculina patagonica]